jgi:hypothetical protein
VWGAPTLAAAKPADASRTEIEHAVVGWHDKTVIRTTLSGAW